jgi:16S rRNA (guanine1207-N2)-methyltransferase
VTRLGHYFENDADLPSKPHEIAIEMRGQAFTFITDRGVFSKNHLDEGSRILIETLSERELGNSVLDLGCGWGPVGILLALYQPSAHVTLADINARALALARSNVTKHRLQNRTTIIESDGFQAIKTMFDSIVTNPPIRAGKSVIYGFYLEAKRHLNSGGSLYLVIRKAQGAASTMAYLKTIYRHVTMVTRKRGYHVYRAHD